MITEPEPSWGDDRSPDRPSSPSPAEVMNDWRPADSWLQHRPAWLWGGLVGAAAASVVWAVLAYTGLAPHRHIPPDLHGYRIGSSPCGGGTFQGLDAAVTASSADSRATPAVFEHTTALDRAQCIYSTQGAARQGSVTEYEVQVDVDLHHRTDPRAEFDSERSVDPQTLEVAAHTTEVPHVGDTAYLLVFDNPTRILKVRSGAAVITLRLVAATHPYGTGPDTETPDLPDLSRLTPSLSDASRAIMAALAA